jgi:hypothetical protein
MHTHQKEKAESGAKIGESGQMESVSTKAFVPSF